MSGSRGSASASSSPHRLASPGLGRGAIFHVDEVLAGPRGLPRGLSAIFHAIAPRDNTLRAKRFARFARFPFPGARTLLKAC